MIDQTQAQPQDELAKAREFELDPLAAASRISRVMSRNAV